MWRKFSAVILVIMSCSVVCFLTMVLLNRFIQRQAITAGISGQLMTTVNHCNPLETKNCLQVPSKQILLIKALDSNTVLDNPEPDILGLFQSALPKGKYQISLADAQSNQSLLCQQALKTSQTCIVEVTQGLTNQNILIVD